MSADCLSIRFRSYEPVLGGMPSSYLSYLKHTTCLPAFHYYDPALASGLRRAPFAPMAAKPCTHCLPIWVETCRTRFLAAAIRSIYFNRAQLPLLRHITSSVMSPFGRQQRGTTFSLHSSVASFHYRKAVLRILGQKAAHALVCAHYGYGLGCMRGMVGFSGF